MRELKYEGGSIHGHWGLVRLFRRSTSHPDGELRYGVRTLDGRVTEFAVQLYCREDGEWRLVAQFDHNPEMGQGHDVRTEGVHMDVFRPSGRRAVADQADPGPMNPESALEFAINYLAEHDERLIERYRRWSTG